MNFQMFASVEKGMLKSSYSATYNMYVVKVVSASQTYN